MKLFNLFKRKKNKKEKFEQYSRDELGLLPEKENSNEDIFVTPKEKQEYVSTLKIINTEEDAPAPEKKADPKPTKKVSDSNESAKKNATKNTNTATKSKAETKSDVVDDVPQKVKETSSERLANFEIKKAKDGRFVFNLYASNRVIVATSQIYSTSQAAINGINSVIANAKKAPVEDTTLKKFEAQSYPKWEIYLDKSEQFRFRLYAPNGNCICHSQGYTSKASCKNGIDSIIRSCENSEITKAYLNKDNK